MRRVCLVVACLAALLALAAPARAECTPVGPVQAGCPQPSPTPSPTPTQTPHSQEASGQQTPAEMERDFFERLNQERTRRGLRRLAYNADLTEIARRHSARMAESGRLYHNTAELSSSEFNRRMGNPEMVGENVGQGPSVEWLHEAFMDSPEHRSNIVEPRYTSLGIGVAVRDGTIWVTQDFIRGGTAKVQAKFPPVRRSGSRPAAVSRPVYRQVVPVVPAPVATFVPVPRPARPQISALQLPPIPAPIPPEPPPSRPLLPLAVLATLSAVAFASRRDAGAWI